MIYTEQTNKAMRLAYEAHQGQWDKSGVPYVFHPLHLAEQMPDEDCTVAALLHDVVEDTETTLEDLRKMGFSPRALEAVSLLTHDPAEPYLDYVARVKQNPVARTVKLADLRHNSDLRRIDRVTEKDLARVEKYAAAIRLLED
ncbi:MAG: HD domain-containing protein [Oscillospiraceae bacterium]|nr:HD domain-containing protein [Oscillospiraceae bacterium]